MLNFRIFLKLLSNISSCKWGDRTPDIGLIFEALIESLSRGSIEWRIVKLSILLVLIKAFLSLRAFLLFLLLAFIILPLCLVVLVPLLKLHIEIIKFYILIFSSLIIGLLLLHLFLVSTTTLIVSIPHIMVMVRSSRDHGNLGGSAVWASLVIVSAVDRGIGDRQEVVLLHVFFVRFESDEVICLCSRRVVDGVRDRWYLAYCRRQQLHIRILSWRLIADLLFFFLIWLLFFLFALLHRLPSIKLAALTILLWYSLRLVLFLYLNRCGRALLVLLLLLLLSASTLRVDWSMIDDLRGFPLGCVSLLFLAWWLERYVDLLHQVFVDSGVVTLIIIFIRWFFFDRIFFLGGFCLKHIWLWFLFSFLLLPILTLDFLWVLIVDIDRLLLLVGSCGWCSFQKDSGCNARYLRVELEVSVHNRWH